ncbi:MAG: SMR family transporter [Proteobacteria bacterium]|jgi:small multidrug resistance pump|nr:SMR family transporter [Pseudomonadota bacterium]NLN62693.1 EamA family transporter [Myxococcales bacterium]
MTRGFLFLAIAVLFNGAANVLMKKGMSTAPAGTAWRDIVGHYLTSWPLLVGLALFALNVVAYTQALSRLPLSVAYPVMVSLTGVIVISTSLIWFKENISWMQWSGFAFIICGVVLVTR